MAWHPFDSLWRLTAHVVDSILVAKPIGSLDGVVCEKIRIGVSSRTSPVTRASWTYTCAILCKREGKCESAKCSGFAREGRGGKDEHLHLLH